MATLEDIRPILTERFAEAIEEYLTGALAPGWECAMYRNVPADIRNSKPVPATRTFLSIFSKSLQDLGIPPSDELTGELKGLFFEAPEPFRGG